MDSFVKYFSADSVEELKKEINIYIEGKNLEVTAISVVPSSYHAYFEAIVAFRRV